MRTFPKQLLIFFLCFFMIISLPSLAQKGQQQPSDYFPLPNQATWEYKSLTSNGVESQFSVRVMAIEKQTDGSNWYKVETKSSQSFFDWYSKPTGEVLIQREMGGQGTASAYEGNFEPAKLYLKNPLTVAQKWTWKGKRPGVAPVEVEELNTVEGSEKIIVPAGQFNGLKVVTQVSQGGAKLKKTYWYTAGIGLVKRMIESDNYSSTVELVKYSFKN